MKKILYLFIAFGMFFSCSDDITTEESTPENPVVKTKYLLPKEIKIKTGNYSYSAVYTYDNQDRITKVNISGKDKKDPIWLQSEISYKGNEVKSFSLKTQDKDYGTFVPELSPYEYPEFDKVLSIVINNDFTDLRIKNNHLLYSEFPYSLKVFDNDAELLQSADEGRLQFIYSKEAGIFRNSKTPAWILEYIHEFIAGNDKVGLLGSIYAKKSLDKVYYIDISSELIKLTDNYMYKWGAYDEYGFPHSAKIEWITNIDTSPKKVSLPVTIIYTALENK